MHQFILGMVHIFQPFSKHTSTVNNEVCISQQMHGVSAKQHYGELITP